MVSLSLSWVGTEAALADVLVPNTHPIEYCAEITGMQNFPDYIFFSFNSNKLQKLETGNCLSFSRNNIFEVGAVKASEYNPAKGNPEKLIPTNLVFGGVLTNSLTAIRSVPDSSPLTKAVDVLKIVEVNASKVNLQMVSVRYTYNDGKTAEFPYTDQNKRPAAPAVPPASSIITTSTTTDSGLSWWWFVVIPAVALVGIVAILLLRRRRRSS
jgi:MYXO-CTERM domain-containing protein